MKVASDSPYLGSRIDHLVQELVGGARAHITGLFDHGCVKCNGDEVRNGWRRLEVGDQVEVACEKGRRYAPRPKPRPHAGFGVVFEDRDLIVVDKGADLLTVPTLREEPATLVSRVSQYVRRSHGGRGAFVVHRLDRGVSGLLVFGKTREIADRLRDQFADRKPERRYVALVAGHVASPTGTFRSFLATDKSLNRFSTDDEHVGQLAVTHFRVVERLADATHVEVSLETGRRNQIRVHFAEAGHPVLGDPRYEPERAAHRLWTYKRLALHAQSLALVHPVTKEALKFESPLPREVLRFVHQNRVAPGANSQPELASGWPLRTPGPAPRPRKSKRPGKRKPAAGRRGSGGKKRRGPRA